ncbi:hypothetical protein BpHYR1_054047 [Brachionus plicatilis]|uniref:Uncharacterized protein n=1 Tax=Brachionus plicatilis TaxID=10195 RepID=A0A3M7R9L5_BRAPC|nr:hypothetical protein BpHYR1_054047 [Brachionus plicatilis]
MKILFLRNLQNITHDLVRLHDLTSNVACKNDSKSGLTIFFKFARSGFISKNLYTVGVIIHKKILENIGENYAKK